MRILVTGARGKADAVTIALLLRDEQGVDCWANVDDPVELFMPADAYPAAPGVCAPHEDDDRTAVVVAGRTR